jgi:predicted Zn-ribbon and HTH transcriptional regulator
MLRCLKCGHVFHTDDVVTVPNYVPYGDRYVSEDWDGCPFCRSTDIEDCEVDDDGCD